MKLFDEYRGTDMFYVGVCMGLVLGMGLAYLLVEIIL